jgi:hypothetical protein
MGNHEREAYLKQIKPRYKKASKVGRQRILDEFRAAPYKYTIRAFNRRQQAQRKHPSGRKPLIKTISEFSDI